MKATSDCMLGIAVSFLLYSFIVDRTLADDFFDDEHFDSDDITSEDMGTVLGNHARMPEFVKEPGQVMSLIIILGAVRRFHIHEDQIHQYS